MGKIDSFEEMSSQRNVQSEEDRIYDSAPHAGNNCVNLEEAATSDEMKDDNRGRTVKLNEMSQCPGGLKRQSNFPEDYSSPSKVALVRSFFRSNGHKILPVQFLYL